MSDVRSFNSVVSNNKSVLTCHPSRCNVSVKGTLVSDSNPGILAASVEACLIEGCLVSVNPLTINISISNSINSNVVFFPVSSTSLLINVNSHISEA